MLNQRRRYLNNLNVATEIINTGTAAPFKEPQYIVDNLKLLKLI